jgi:hypothetical protein
LAYLSSKSVTRRIFKPLWRSEIISQSKDAKKKGELWLEIMSCQLIKKLKNERIGSGDSDYTNKSEENKTNLYSPFFILRKINKDLFISWIR